MRWILAIPKQQQEQEQQQEQQTQQNTASPLAQPLTSSIIGLASAIVIFRFSPFLPPPMPPEPPLANLKIWSAIKPGLDPSKVKLAPTPPAPLVSPPARVGTSISIVRSSSAPSFSKALKFSLWFSSAYWPTNTSRIRSSTEAATSCVISSLSLFLVIEMDTSTRSRMIWSTSFPWKPTSVNLVASTLMNGAWDSLAMRRAISVLPQPVGPIMRMFLGITSLRSSSLSWCLRQRLRRAIATARLASFCPTINLFSWSTTSRGLRAARSAERVVAVSTFCASVAVAVVVCSAQGGKSRDQ